MLSLTVNLKITGKVCQLSKLHRGIVRADSEFSFTGVYSVPAYYNEWYPRLMYIKGQKSNLHHAKTYGMDFEYRHFIEQFKPERFNADEWAEIFKKVVQNTLCLLENTTMVSKCMLAI